ncbi:hypothetical protein BDZ89DRAFT_1032494 [Hymenopellis radicata]|nr:hypothetical protein BDZ89DRAFT_1032494 [Hymenopellis radicata]
MAPIRPHNKSRTGCKTCRRRKVKCDEASPVCKNCTRREIECVWADKCTYTAPAQARQSIRSNLHPAPNDMPTFPAVMSSSSLDLRSLELIHQYTTSTCYTFCAEASALEVWKVIIPRIAVSTDNPFLLHSLLAVSALHLHTLNPNHPMADKYASSAFTHFSQAVNSVPSNTTDYVDDGTLFISQILIGIYGFATSPAVHTQSDWLRVLRASSSTFRTRWSTLQHGVIAPMIPWIAAPLDIHEPLGNVPPFPQSLSTLPLPICGAPDQDEVRDGAISATYQHAISFLRRSWVASFYPDYQMHAAFFWLILASDSFMALLSERRPRALILLGHYCAIMQRMNGPWWTKRDWDWR